MPKKTRKQLPIPKEKEIYNICKHGKCTDPSLAYNISDVPVCTTHEKSIFENNTHHTIISFKDQYGNATYNMVYNSICTMCGILKGQLVQGSTLKDYIRDMYHVPTEVSKGRNDKFPKYLNNHTLSNYNCESCLANENGSECEHNLVIQNGYTSGTCYCCTQNMLDTECLCQNCKWKAILRDNSDWEDNQYLLTELDGMGNFIYSWEEI